MRLERLEHRFVDQMPKREELQEGVLYIAMGFGLAVHLCACGCGEKTVTPFSPAEWSITCDGESVSLQPSIGNWSFDCRSHYWIRDDEIIWGKPLTETMIATVRAGDTVAAERYYDGADEPQPYELVPKTPAPSLWRRIRDWFRG